MVNGMNNRSRQFKTVIFEQFGLFWLFIGEITEGETWSNGKAVSV